MAQTGNFRKKGYEYTGALNILKVALSYDYLWTNIRVKGRCIWLYERVQTLVVRVSLFLTVIHI